MAAQSQTERLLAVLDALDPASDDKSTKILRARISFDKQPQMVATTLPSFSLVEKKGLWFWCSSTLIESELLGPFPSQEEAEKDAKATLRITDV